MKNKIIITAVAFLLGVSTWLLGFTPHPVGSVISGQAYYATTTRSTSASATYSYPACLGNATLGSVVVVQPATAGYVRLWSATSTATSTYQTQNPSLASTLTFGKPIAQILSASDVVGTLTFDSSVVNGVIIETSSGFDGEYVVTCRN